MLFNDVKLQALELLGEYETPESRRLEYKEELPLDDKSQKREFCADVSAFANADGGYLLVGIKDGKENEGKPIVLGIPKPPNTDGYISDLENIIKSGVEPNIHGINIKVIDWGESDESRIVLVIFIPSSWSKPHWIGREKSRSFCSRKSNGKYHLDITEVRQMFLLSETIPERIRDFRASRIAVINEGATPAILNDGPKVVLHVVPFSAISLNEQLDLPALTHPLDQSGKRRLYSDNLRYNFEGLYRAPLVDEGSNFYQVFRNGSLEFVRVVQQQNEGEIFAPDIGEIISDTYLPRMLEWYDILNVNSPMFYMLSILNVQNQKLTMRTAGGSEFLVGSIDPTDIRAIVDKDHLLTTEVHVETIETDANTIMRLLRPALDAVWQASGWPEAKGYDAEGNWVGIKLN